jgi:hypothetical protein
LRRDALAPLTWLPWQSLVKLPLLDDVSPGRFALLTDLALSVLLAIGIDEARRWFLSRRQSTAPAHQHQTGPSPERAGGVTNILVSFLVLLVAATAVLYPIWRNYSVPTATNTVELPPWFTTAATRVPSGSVVLTYPFPASSSLSSEPMIWQAVDGMHFSLAGGYLKVPGPGGSPLQAGAPGSATYSLDLLTLAKQTQKTPWLPASSDLSNLRSAFATWKVDYIVIPATGINPVFTAAVMTAVTGQLPVVSHRAWVWDVRQTALAPFSGVTASSAFKSCRSVSALYQAVPADVALPQIANLCVSKALRG